MNIWLNENFYDNKKIKRLIKECGAEAIPALHKLWFYAYKYAVDNLLSEDKLGILKDCDKVDIEIISGWENDKVDFLEILKSLKLLVEKYGQYYIHDFSDNNPQLIVLINQKINGSKYAKRRWENKQKGDSMGDPPSDPMQTEKKRKEKKRSKEKIDKKETEIELPDWLDKKAWSEFVQHRKDIKKAIKSSIAITKLINKLSEDKLNHVTMINNAIAGGYQSVYPIKLSGSGKKPANHLPVEDGKYDEY